MILEDILDLAKMLLVGSLAFVAILLSPFAIAGIYDSLTDDLGPVWTECADSGFQPDCH